MDLDVLYRNAFLIAVNKPSGMLVHRGWGQDDFVLVDLVREAVGGRTVHPLHRLDRQTSGVVLFALDIDTARALSSAFERGDIEKTYMTLVRGTAPCSGIIDHPIPRKENGPRVEAVTEFERVATLDTLPRETSWMRARPRTGRLHQIRRHFKHLSHPVIGDAVYGKGDINRAFRATYDLCRTALHAAQIAFNHPEDGSRVIVDAPIPPDLVIPLVRMGLSPASLDPRGLFATVSEAIR